MDGGEHVVTTFVDELRFGYGIAAPQEEDDAAAPFGKGSDGGVGKGFPSMPLVRSSLVGAHGEGGVEQQHTLIGPALQIA